MTAADQYTRADPLFRQALRHGANTGPGFEVSGSTEVSLGWLLYHAVALVAVFGSLGFVLYVGLWAAGR